MVEIDLGWIRLCSTRSGSYELQLIGQRGPSAKNAGEPYVRQRLSQPSLGAALERLLDLAPAESGQEIRTLAELRRCLQDTQRFLHEALHGKPPPLRCVGCGRFRSVSALALSEPPTCRDCHGNQEDCYDVS